jgi:hypothetical protein
MPKWFIPVLVVPVLAVAAIWLMGPGSSKDSTATGSPEARILAYLDENVGPRHFMLVTDLYNNVFTTPDEREALQGLYDSLFEIPAYVARVYMETSRIPTVQTISDHFDFQVPGTTITLLRVLESDPRIPPFFERDLTTGEITQIDVDAIAAHDRFGRPLRN